MYFPPDIKLAAFNHFCADMVLPIVVVEKTALIGSKLRL